MLEAGRVVYQRTFWWRLAALFAAASLAAWLVTPPSTMAGAITLKNSKGVEVHILRCACARFCAIGPANQLRALAAS